MHQWTQAVAPCSGLCVAGLAQAEGLSGTGACPGVRGCKCSAAAVGLSFNEAGLNPRNELLVPGIYLIVLLKVQGLVFMFISG